MYDVIVIGAGVIGSCTAYHLVKQGYKTLLLDQITALPNVDFTDPGPYIPTPRLDCQKKTTFSLPHTRGSSHGHSRLTKRSNWKPFCADLIPEAIRVWRELENISGKSLLVNTGHLSIATKTTRSGLVKHLASYLSEKGVSYSYYSGNDIAQAFPGLLFDDSYEALYEPNGMLMRADNCLQALWSQFILLGGSLFDGEKVESIQVIDENEVKVITSKSEYHSKSTVLTCGTWINKLLKTVNLKLPVETKRVVTYYWKAKEPEKHPDKPVVPPLMIYFPEYHIYSLSAYEYPGMVKVCYHYRATADPDKRDSPMSQEDAQQHSDRLATLKKVIDKHFSYLEPQPAIEETCMQTMTAKADFIMDHHPEHKNVVIGAGFSGHGFGPAPTIGRILSNLATFQEPGCEMEQCSLRRSVQLAKL